MYLFGTQAYLFGIGFSIGVIFIAFIIVPIIYPLNITSALEYLNLRFNARHPKLVALLITIGKLLLYMGITLFASGIALQGASGFPVWASILILGVVSTVYTSIGGMKAVVWTDTLQGEKNE